MKNEVVCKRHIQNVQLMMIFAVIKNYYYVFAHENRHWIRVTNNEEIERKKFPVKYLT